MCEKNVPSAFLKIFTVLAILLDVCNSLFKGWKYLKNVCETPTPHPWGSAVGKKMTENPEKLENESKILEKFGN